MRGVNSENLVAIIDFLYRGEANVPQDNLDSVILVAEDLKLKGLVGSTEEARDEESKSSFFSKNPNNQASSNLHFVREEDSIFKHDKDILILPKKDPHSNPDFGKDERQIGTLNDSDEYMQELDEKVKSMIEKSDKKMAVGKTFKRVCLCKVCGKEGQYVAIRDHIEANHLEGVSLACNQCEKTFRSRASLRMHKSVIHKTSQTENFSF